jgi:hypothetical protein
MSDPNPTYYPGLVSQAKSRGVNFLPVLTPINDVWSNASLQDVHDGCYNFAYNVAKSFGSNVNYYELANELDGYAILGSTYDGWDWSSYDAGRCDRAYTELVGLAQGVKAANPNAQVMIDAGWLHKGFIQEMVNRGLNFDILAWHWYSNMGDITDVPSYGNVWATLQSSFNKPIWITEGGNVNGGDLDPTQTNLIGSQAAQFRQLGAGVYFEYELLDEPYKSNDQAWYGLVPVTWNGSQYVPDTPKPAYTRYQKVIAGGGAISNGTYTLTPQCATGSRLDVPNSGSSPGTYLEIWQANGGANQSWTFTDMGNGYYKIQPSYALGLALDVYGAASADGTRVDIWSDNGSWSQRWMPVWAYGGYEFIPQCATGSRLDVTGAASSNGTQVEIWSANGTGAQTWTLN